MWLQFQKKSKSKNFGRFSKIRTAKFSASQKKGLEDLVKTPFEFTTNKNPIFCKTNHIPVGTKTGKNFLTKISNFAHVKLQTWSRQKLKDWILAAN